MFSESRVGRIAIILHQARTFVEAWCDDYNYRRAYLDQCRPLPCPWATTAYCLGNWTRRLAYTQPQQPRKLVTDRLLPLAQRPCDSVITRASSLTSLVLADQTSRPLSCLAPVRRSRCRDFTPTLQPTPVDAIPLVPFAPLCFRRSCDLFTVPHPTLAGRL